MRHRWWHGGCLALLLGLAVTSAAAPPLIPPGRAKLSAPDNVLCPVVGLDAVVVWDLVADANAYQVAWVGIMGDGTVVEDSAFVVMPPEPIALEAFVAVTVHVRALPPPKHDGGPLQGSGPKGRWSAPCVVDIPTLPVP